MSVAYEADPTQPEKKVAQPGPAPVPYGPSGGGAGISAPIDPATGRYNFGNPYYNKFAESPEGAWALLQSYLFGPPKRGGGPFDSIMDAFLKPLAFAIAQAGGIDGTAYNLNDIFSEFGQAIQGAGGGFNQYAQGLSNKVMNSIDDRALSYEELIPRLTAAGALQSSTMNPLAGKSWMNDLGFSIDELRHRNTVNPGSMYDGDWSKYFQETDFWKQYLAQQSGAQQGR